MRHPPPCAFVRLPRSAESRAEKRTSRYLACPKRAHGWPQVVSQHQQLPFRHHFSWPYMSSSILTAPGRGPTLTVFSSAVSAVPYSVNQDDETVPLPRSGFVRGDPHRRVAPCTSGRTDG